MHLPKKIAVTGAAGLFGRVLVGVFRARHEVFPLTRAEADLTRGDQVQKVLARLRPNVVVHAAAIPDLDVCEADPELAHAVNVEGTRHVVEAARALGAAVVCISTDAVFDGLKRSPYTESDPPNPPTVYGRTKLLAEQIVASLEKHWIFRVPVLFGPGKTNFVEKGLRKIARGEQYVVAADQVAGALYTPDAAAKIMQVIEADYPGLFHLANTGVCSRLELAQRAAELAGLDPERVVGKPAEQMGRRALRLKYSVMEMERLRQGGFELPRPWEEALAAYLKGFRLKQPG